MKTINFLVDQDWQAGWPEEGCICRYLGKDYDKDRMRTNVLFEVIGNPVAKPNIEFIKIPCGV